MAAKVHIQENDNTVRAKTPDHDYLAGHMTAIIRE